jgi:hypothetical protein
MFLIPYVEWPSSLSDILFVTVSTAKLIYSTSIVFVVLFVTVFSQQCNNIALGGKGNASIEGREQFSDESFFYACVSKFCPLCFLCS